MAESIFSQLQADAFRSGVTPRTREATQWFRKKASALKSVRRYDLLKDDIVTKTNKPMPGEMIMYFYDPKTKASLPYYDMFPLVILVDKAPGGWYGMNLHYLHPLVRARFLDRLMDTASDKRYDEDTRLKINYQMLKTAARYKQFAPTFKRYLSKQVESNMVKVNMTEWPIAAFLPTEDFAKASKSTVWKESSKAYRK